VGHLGIGVPLVDQHGNYQYKAFGVPGLGLKRGLSENLVVAPYATALAAMVDPTSAVVNFKRLAREGALRRYGYYEALDYTQREEFRETEASAEKTAALTPGAPASAPAEALPRVQTVRAFFAHHQGMSLVSLANAILGAPMVRRFHADPRVRATEPLLQERVPRYVPVTEAAPARDGARTAPCGHGVAALLPLAAYAIPARPLPVERPVHRGDHQWRRRHQHLEWHGGDAAARRRDPPTPAASSSTSATCAADDRGRRRISRCAGSRTATG
jgi:hypothetical protein